MPDIYDAAAKHRAALLAGDRAVANELTEAYGRSWAALQTDLNRVTAQIVAEQAEGRAPAPAMVERDARVRALMRQAERRIGEFAHLADLAIQDAQRGAIASAIDHAGTEVGAGLSATAPGIGDSFRRLDTEALESMVGHLGNGSPLRSLLGQLGAEAAQSVRSGLVIGIARGLSPRDVAREVRAALGGNLARALTIARTETLRAYREATRRVYEENAEVVAGWVWVAKLDGRTCGACWAMHGSEHPATEHLDGHPNCRCAMVPATRTWDELGVTGIPETRPSIETGPEAFERLGPDAQRAILGRAKFEAYARGDLHLGDLVGRRSDPDWETTRGERSLRQIQAARATGIDDEAFRLGTGLEGPEPPKRRRASAGTEGMTPTQVRAARADLEPVRARMRTEARTVQDDALGWFDRHEGGILRPPPPRAQATGEWDWFYGLSPDEQKRLRRGRWFGDETNMGPDELADTMGLGGSGTDVAQAMEEWVAQARRFDAAGALARGKLPSGRAYGNLDPDGLLPDIAAEGYRLPRLLDPDLEAAAGHVGAVHAELAEAGAARLLRPSRLGPDPWAMTTDDYADELTQLAEQVERARPVSSDDWGEVYDRETTRAIERLGELWPEELDPAGDLTIDAMHARITETARLAGRLEA